MKRILLVTGSLKRGGLETVAMNIVRWSDKERYKFDFLVYSTEEYAYEKEAKELGCKIIKLELSNIKIVNYIKCIKEVIKDNGPYDIVHTHMYFNSGIVALAARLSGVPICIAHSHSIGRTEEDTIKIKIKQKILRGLIKHNCDILCACSKEAGEHVFGKSVFRRKGKVVLNPIDFNCFSYNELDRKRIREEFNIDYEKTVLGHVSRLVKEKNQKFLIDILEEYKKKKDAILLIVGDGEVRESLEEYSREKGISKNVIFTGERSDIGALLSCMDVFLMSSLHEGLGIVMLEAMANGLTCICEDKAIVEEIKSLNQCKVMTDFKTSDWCEKIDKIIDTSRITNKEIENNLANFTREKFIKTMSFIYDKY